ncbi:MAG TPA: molybdate ABC transporter substrate-binding protein [Acidimicrobiia bacterium]|nr:molybdate ABC transporter substrate-binding protein [Acidimicrobiia bacterium]
MSARRPRRHAARASAAALALLFVVGSTACSRDTDDRATLRIFAASSLTDAFTELAAAFERTRPGVDVQLAFGGSSQLATQLVEGAPADVLATADAESYSRARDADAVDDGVGFATNVLEVVASADDDRVQLLRDLARTDVVVVLCASEVPCGRLADQVLDAARIPTRAASREPNAQAVLTKVALGEADAGIVYTTDVRNAGPGVRGVTIPPEQNVETTYLIGVVRDTDSRAHADAWVAFVRSSAGQQVLADLGFGT